MERNSFDIAVVGAGASGLMAAIFAAAEGGKVAVLEKNDQPGRKIMITGKGRCNITNTKPQDEFRSHIHDHRNFFVRAFETMNNAATIDFFNSIGLETKVEAGDRVYPASDNAKDVSAALVAEAERRGAEIMCGMEVTSVEKDDEIFHIKCGDDFEITSKALIICTGGLSYPGTGSTGDGYAFAKSLGHTVTDCFPSLTALMPSDYDSMLEGVNSYLEFVRNKRSNVHSNPDEEKYNGIHLKNVEARLFADNDLLQEEFGELEFTSDGIEGPIGLRLSRRAIAALRRGQDVVVEIDLKPALFLDKLDQRIKNEILAAVRAIMDSNKGMSIRDSYAKLGYDYANPTPKGLSDLLKKLIPMELVTPFLMSHGHLTFDNMADALKTWRFNIVSYKGYERSVVTAGGVTTDEVVPKTMESRLVHGLYFAGELLDVDGDTGGYNLQIAFSTGALAGSSAWKKIKFGK